jgi:glycosyltransferase involved in cell wall biosynthesis
VEKSLRILQLCKKFPYPLKDGESVAVTQLSKALNQLGCEISLLCMNTSKHYFDIKDLPKEYNHYKEIHFTTVDNSIKPVDALKNLFSKESYHVARFVSKKFENKLIELLKSNEFDIIQMETLYLAPYIDTIKKYSNAIVSMRAHNVESEIWERITSNTSFLPKKMYLNYLTSKLKRFELENLNSYDYLIAVTEKDLKTFKEMGYKNGAMASPIGIDLKNYGTKDIQGIKLEDSLCFLGSLDWMPNLEGLNWFLKKVWPVLHMQRPYLKFHIAGRNTPDHILNLDAPNVVVHGEVENATEFLANHSILLVPLFSGSGMRVKILEGMANGNVIITTAMGAEGIPYTDSENILIANNKEMFLSQIQSCLDNPVLMKTISNNAKTLVNKNFDYIQVGKQLLQSYKAKLKH